MDEFKKYINQHRHQLDTDEPGDHLFDSIERRLNPSKPRVIPMFVKWAVAACIILLAGIAIYIFSSGGLNKSQDIAKTTPAGKIDSSSSSEIKKPIENEDPIEEEQSSKMLAQLPARKESVNQDKPYRAETILNSQKEVIAKKAPAQSTDPMLRAFNDMDKSYATMVSLQLEKVKGTPIYAEDAGYFHVFKKEFQDLTNDEKMLKEETKKNGINDDIINRMINIYQEKISLLKQLQFEINKMNNRMKNTSPEVQKKQSPTYINL
ncbi:MAG TPA: hypothetical protein VF622_17320 [Segetibacter sp.]|jgi:hypothetical protein